MSLSRSRVLLVGALLSAGQSVQVAADSPPTAQDCALVSDSTARLSCFDQIYTTSPPEVVVSEVQAADEPRSGSEQKAIQEQVVERQKQAPAVKRANRLQGKLVGNRHSPSKLTSHIKALRTRDRQRMVFLLENGDVWMQTSPRNLPIQVGDAVSIKRGLFGGHILRTEHRVASRVHQLQ